jgi:hypothetical protein
MLINIRLTPGQPSGHPLKGRGGARGPPPQIVNPRPLYLQRGLGERKDTRLASTTNYKKETIMEMTLRYLDLGVSRIRDIRRILLAWDEALTLAEAFGCTPGQAFDALNVRVSLPGWVPDKGVALNFAAHKPLLDHFLEVLDVEGIDFEEVPGLWRYQII